MRIAYNARILQTPRTGIGHYLCELVTALSVFDDLEIQLFDGKHWRTHLPPPRQSVQNQRLARVKQRIPFAYALRRRREQFFFDRGMRDQPADIYHDPSLWPLHFDGPTVMTVHDLTHLQYPETQPIDRLREINKRLPASLERVAYILVDSQFIAGELMRYYNVAPSRISVAPLGYAPRFHLRDHHTLQQQLRPLGVAPDSYVLCVGTLEPRKNLTLALRAHALLPHDLRSRFPLLIVGMSGWKMHHLTHELDQALRSGHVRLLGYQSDDQVAALTAGARLMLFPSRYEGFGLPVLEAMASGTPVMLAEQAAMPEVAGDAGIYVPLNDEQAWANTLQQLLADEGQRDLFRQRGLERARQFSWQHCANITANVYRQVLLS